MPRSWGYPCITLWRISVFEIELCHFFLGHHFGDDGRRVSCSSIVAPSCCPLLWHQISSHIMISHYRQQRGRRMLSSLLRWLGPSLQVRSPGYQLCLRHFYAANIPTLLDSLLQKLYISNVTPILNNIQPGLMNLW